MNRLTLTHLCVFSRSSGASCRKLCVCTLLTGRSAEPPRRRRARMVRARLRSHPNLTAGRAVQRLCGEGRAFLTQLTCRDINITVESCSFTAFEPGCAATDCATVKTEAGSTAGSSKMNGTPRFFGHGVRIRCEHRLKEMPQSATTAITAVSGTERQERNRFSTAPV